MTEDLRAPQPEQRPADPEAARRAWQARMAAQRTGSMDTRQMAAIRGAVQQPPQAAQPPAPRPAAPAAPPRPAAPAQSTGAFPRQSARDTAAPAPEDPEADFTQTLSLDGILPAEQRAPHVTVQWRTPLPAAELPPRPADAAPVSDTTVDPILTEVLRAAEADAQHAAVPPAQPGPAQGEGTAEPEQPAPAERPGAPGKALARVLAALWAAVRGVLFAAFTAVKVAALAAIPLFIFWYGYTIDRNGWFQGEQYEREVAQALLEGHSITNYTNMEEREILKIYAQNLDEAPAAISLGSSRILQLTRKLAGEENFFNAGLIGAEYCDIFDSYYVFDRVGLIPGTVIVGIDPWIFSGAPDANTFKRVDMQMWNEYQRYILGRTDVDVTQAADNMNFWIALTSPAFFHETMDYYIDNKENGLRPQIFDGDLAKEPGEVKMPDGSVWYGTTFRSLTQEEVNATAQEQFNASFINCEEFYELDAEHVALFRSFIEYMEGRGSRVILFLTPYHPNAYNWVLNFPQRYSGFFQVESWVRQYAAEHGIPVYGSYDPLAVGCTEADFFDAWHVKDTGIAKFFPGLPAIHAAWDAGTLPDPLAVTPRLPTAETDPVV